MPNRHNPYTTAGRQRRPSRRTNPCVYVFVLVALFAVIFAIGGAIYVATKTTVTFTVTDKNIKYVRDSDGKNGKDVYMIFTDHGVFKDEDTIFAWKWNSSDLYAKLKVGQKYTCTASGFRIGFTSSYKNLVNCK